MTNNWNVSTEQTNRLTLANKQGEISGRGICKASSSHPLVHYSPRYKSRLANKAASGHLHRFWNCLWPTMCGCDWLWQWRAKVLSHPISHPPVHPSTHPFTHLSTQATSDPPHSFPFSGPLDRFLHSATFCKNCESFITSGQRIKVNENVLHKVEMKDAVLCEVECEWRSGCKVT